MRIGEGQPVGDYPTVVRVRCQEHFGAGCKAQGARYRAWSMEKYSGQEADCSGQKKDVDGWYG